MQKNILTISFTILALFFVGDLAAENTVGVKNSDKTEQQPQQPKKEIVPEPMDGDATGGASDSPERIESADSVNYGENAFQKFNFIFYFLYKYKYDKDPRYGNGLAPLGLEAN